MKSTMNNGHSNPINIQTCPSKYTIKPSEAKGFQIDDCFQDIDKIQGFEGTKDYYYDSYSHLNIHEEMLRDTQRTNCYKKAILSNKHLFQDKIVLDVGSGTGILSIFAAKAGAKHVYGVENAGICTIQSKLLKIAKFSKMIVEENNLQDKVTIMQGKIEEITLPVEKVDIIISEWMGYFLLYESMLDCILFARNKYLDQNGLIFPDRAILYIATMEDEQYRDQTINFWDNVYGVQMKSLKGWALRQPLVEIIDNLNGDAQAILDIDLHTVKVGDLDFTTDYSMKIHRNDMVHAIAGWFEVYFSHCHIPIRLSTAPFYEATHWKQTIFYLEEPFPVHNGDELKGSIAVKKSKLNPRYLDVKMSFHLKNRVQDYNHEQFFKMT